MRVNLVYENIYIKCNPGALNKGELKEPAEGSPSLYSIYVGELLAAYRSEPWSTRGL